MTTADVKIDEKMSVADPEVRRLVEESRLSSESSMLYGKCSAWVRWQEDQGLPISEIVAFAQAATETRREEAIKDRGFRIIDVKNDVAGGEKKLVARSAFYDFSVGNRGGRGGNYCFSN